MSNVYVVMGSTGEYSDRSEWIVCAFKDVVKAESLVQACNTRADQWVAKRKDEYDAMPKNWMAGYDTVGYMSYTGSHYWYEEVDCE